MPIISGELCSIEDVKLYLGITDASDDTLLAMLITKCSDFIKEWLGRKAIQGTTVVDEYQDGGFDRFYTREWPIIAVAGISEDQGHAWGAGTLVNPSQYFVDKPNGLIIRHNGVQFLQGKRTLLVSYDAGYGGTGASSVPQGIQQAAIEFVASKYQRRKRSSIASQTLKDGTRSYFSATDMSKEIMTMLWPYKSEHRG